eukprot:TRINITY_DN33506_c0_g1_i1.p1 TRINITY_DN33506_c0_g1~~TRINITY_DN33506_c0_g1_i1.p1  ORF type:complete len:264 (-),score=55.94 TRINITY_DN33506_c0_g1_i1:328-1119(-)
MEETNANGTHSEDTSVETKESESAQLITKMREKIADDALAKEADDATIERFLRARNMNVDKASKMLIEHAKWRTSFMPEGFIPDKDIAKEMEAEKVGLHVKPGHRSLLIVLARKHLVKTRDLEMNTRFAVHSMDKCIASLPPGEEKFFGLLDLSKSGAKNIDVKALIAIFGILQAHYPERVGQLFLVHVPYVFWSFWKLVEPFVDPITRKKIHFVEDKNLTSVLLAAMPADIVPKDYGGKAEITWIQDVVVEGWPPVGSVPFV